MRNTTEDGKNEEGKNYCSIKGTLAKGFSGRQQNDGREVSEELGE